MGLLDYARENLPYSWEYVLAKNKCKTKVLKCIVKSIPVAYTGKYHYREGIGYLKRIFKHSLLSSINAKHLTENEIQLVQEMSEKISQYEEQCR